MKKAVISQTVNLLQGGCNVCGIVEDVNYSLTLEDDSSPLDELTVNSLVTAITKKAGYKQTYRIDEVEDFIIYTKKDHTVIVKEEYNQLTYFYDERTYSTSDQLIDKIKLAETVQQLLANFFNIEGVIISIDDSII